MKVIGWLIIIGGLWLATMIPIAGLIVMGIGILFTATSKRNQYFNSKMKAEKKRVKLEIPCPYCREPILAGATKCRHCMSEIEYGKYK